MEEVVGSIPTRSTKSPNNLDSASIHGQGVCVVLSSRCFSSSDRALPIVEGSRSGRVHLG
jgi:hypothetical protein